jgi:DNA-binding transcriptional LysR family regulator
MHLKQLTYFVAVIEAHSFSQAAKNLYISQPTLSQSIQALEKELGFELLLRTSSGAIPTEMGEVVFRDAKMLLQKTEAVQQKWARLENARKALNGTVHLVVFPTAYFFVSQQISTRFQAAFPSMHWQLLESRGYNLPDIFSRHRADIGIGDFISSEKDTFLRELARYGLRVDPLCDDVCKIAISKKNPLAGKSDLSASDAQQLSLAYYSGGDDVADPHFTRFFDDKLAIELHSFEKIVDTAVSGIAVAPLPQKITSKGLLRRYGRDAVNFLTVEGFSLPVTHCLIYPDGAPATPEIKQAKKLICKAYRELEYSPLQDE